MTKDRDAREVLGEILRRMGIDATIDVRDEADRVVLDIQGPEAGLVIGKKGQTLEALQFLLSKMVHRGAEADIAGLSRGVGKPIVVDSGGYRGRREGALVELATRLGEKARHTGRTITVNPMSPHERRIIHITLDKVPGVTTRSEGEGIFRRLLIIPAPEKGAPEKGEPVADEG
jgi:spoIIIJ-associated protein